MNPDAQRIAIGQALGKDLTAYRFQHQSVSAASPQWSPAYGTREEAQEESDREHRRWHTTVWPVESFVNPGEAPNYLRDLNAMNEAELSLSEESPGLDSSGNPIKSDRARFREALCVVTLGRGGPIHASAAFRAEAFLKTLNLWDDAL